MKYLLIFFLVIINSCVARELVLKDSLINFDNFNNKIFISKTSFDNKSNDNIAQEINKEIIKLFKNNEKVKIIDKIEESNLIVESKIIDFTESIYLDQYNSIYSNINNRNFVNLQLSLSLEIKIINNGNNNILLNENVNDIESIQLNNISDIQIEALNNKNDNLYIDLRNKLIQNIIKKISYYINPSYIYVNVSE
ncbi:MAG: hypothetical protein KatS3mg068_1883 [Candidatus Sericytochromatia bacterium]|nr:MAG: hypothetical protein KatS3mg068_1883 [Candidatus Sericytochromatia bacterium]